MWILFDKKFTASTYNYFRIITLSHIVQLAFAIPYGMCYTPAFFPKMNSYSCAIVQCVYIPYSSFASNFAALLEIGVLFERMKIMNSFVKKHFTITPSKVILITLFPCLLLNSIYAFVYVPYNGGEYYYYTSTSGIQNVNSFWYVSTSPLADSFIGQIFLIVFYFLRDILTMTLTIVLSTVSLVEMKSYFKKRDQILHYPTIAIQIVSSNQSMNTVVNQSEKRKKSEKSAIKLVLTKCFISTIMRSVMLIGDIYYLFSSNYLVILLGSIKGLVLVVGPSMSYFVFYHFNRDFRKKFLNMTSHFHKKFRQMSLN
jgi:hypothetical protein